MSQYVYSKQTHYQQLIPYHLNHDPIVEGNTSHGRCIQAGNEELPERLEEARSPFSRAAPHAILYHVILYHNMYILNNTLSI